MYILNWHNLTGVHCGSVAIRNVANYYGVNYEEALCFGLGSGMGFFYSKNKEGKPSEVIHLRAPNMEPNFFSNSNLKYSNLETLLRFEHQSTCLLYTSPSPRDRTRSRMPASA